MRSSIVSRLVIFAALGLLSLGTVAGATGVTVLDAAEAALVPTPLVAVTVNV